jgi:hypothetical protein
MHAGLAPVEALLEGRTRGEEGQRAEHDQDGRGAEHGTGPVLPGATRLPGAQAVAQLVEARPRPQDHEHDAQREVREDPAQVRGSPHHEQDHGDEAEQDADDGEATE